MRTRKRGKKLIKGRIVLFSKDQVREMQCASSGRELYDLLGKATGRDLYRRGG